MIIRISILYIKPMTSQQISLMVLCPDVIGHILSFDKGSYITPLVCREFNDHTKKYKNAVKVISNFYYRYLLHTQESYTRSTMIRYYIAVPYESNKDKINYILSKKITELSDKSDNSQTLKNILCRLSYENLRKLFLEKLKRF
jgi:hypothetical protein